MTMLDRMRRHKSWLKWSLGIVVAAFVLLYIPSFLDPAATGPGAAPTDVVANVEGRPITVATFQRAYSNQLMQFQNAYGTLPPALLQQLQIGQSVLQQLVTQEAVVAEATRRGLTVTDGELREHLVRMPGLQENGQFIGWSRYRQVLQTTRPPMQPAEFEADLRASILSLKLQAAVTAWIHVSDQDVEDAYRQQHERVQLDLAVFQASAFEEGLAPTNAELTAEYELHPDIYRVPEKRRVRHVVLDTASLRAGIAVTPQEVEARYRDNIGIYSTPEQVRASHILFEVAEGEDEAAVREDAERVLGRARAGEDFAALAREFSDDTGSRDAGGDLDYFGRGAMVAEFEVAAWALEPGEISDLVRSDYGFHIIKVADKRAAMTRTLDDVRLELEEQIRTEKAQAEATRLAGELAAATDSADDLDEAAAARGLSVGDSGLFARDEPLAGIGFAPNVAAAAFELEAGGVSDAISTGQGYAIIALEEVAPPALPPFDDVRDSVRANVVQAQALAIARTRAEDLAGTSGGAFAEAARRAGAVVRSTDPVPRGSVLPDIGVSPRVDQAVFALDAGQTTEPIDVGSAIVVAQVTGRQDIEPDALVAARDDLRAQLTQERRTAFFEAYMSDATDRLTITYNDATVQQVLDTF